MSTGRTAGSSAAPVPPLWSGRFVLVCATYFFVAMIFYLLMTAMAAYAALRFGASEAQAGVVVGAFVLGAVVTRIVTTPATEAWGRRPVLLAALGAYVLSSAAYLLADSLVTLTAVRFVHGMCFGAAGTVLATAVQTIVPPSRRSEGTGWFSTAMTVSGAFGPMIALQLAERAGAQSLFWAATGFTLAAFVLGLFLHVPETERTGRLRIRAREVVSAEAAPVSAVILATGFCYGAVLAFTAAYAAEQDYGATVPSVFFAVFAAGTVLGRAVLAPIHDRRGDNAVAYPILVVLAAAYTVIALWRSPVGMLVGAAVMGLSYGPVVSVFQTIAVKVAGPAAVGVATGTFFLFIDIGTGIGPMVLGSVVPATGVGGMFLVCAAVTLATVGYYHLAHGRRPIARRGSASV